MLSVITNIYNKKIKGPTLMEMFTATVKQSKCVHHGWQGTHRCNIQVLAKHASTRVHRLSSLLQWSVPSGTNVSATGLWIQTIGGTVTTLCQQVEF
jgi:hypothetical protein